jgi:Cu/Ag efflux protein CusF
MVCRRTVACPIRPRCNAEFSITNLNLSQLGKTPMKSLTVSISRPIIVLLAALALQACGDKPSEPAASKSSEPAADKTGVPVVREELHHATAVVEAIDAQTREITLKGENGSLSFVAGPDVRNFDNIHVGDRVNVAYYEALVAELKKKGTGVAEPVEVASATRAAVGDAPAASAGRTVTGTVKIESYDTATDTVVFVNSGGVRHTIAVQAQNMKEFARTLKPGDEVELTYVEGVAVEVVPGQ